MGQQYAGRHRQPGRHRAPTVSARHRLPAKVVRRPLLTTGAAVALIGASAAGYARAGDAFTTSAATFTVPAKAISQANEANNEQLEQSAYRMKAATTSAMQSAANADRARAEAAAKAAKAKADAAAKAALLAQQRQQEQQRAAREAQRQSIIANAQSDPKSVARMMLGDYGWSDGQWSCLEQLWTGESGWNYKATNASSGAYGIPQSLPASKMASAGADYRDNPVTQITWGMQYVKSSYGSPCNALDQWNSRSPHWY